MDVDGETLREFFNSVLPHLNEKQRKIVAGAMVGILGRGGKTAVAEASGMSRNTVIDAHRKVRDGIEISDRQRAPGGGRPSITDSQPGILEALDELVHPGTRGNPMSLLRYTLKSTTQLAAELTRQGFDTSADSVGRLLKRLGYSLQAPRKRREGTSHPDRDGQFRYINEQAARFTKRGQPVVSVDTKKKELVGNYDNGGREYQPKGEPVEVNTYDFPDPEVGKAIPYGIYDVTNNEGWVSVGDAADTAEFAVNALRTWWNTMGRARFPDARELLVCADGGGSNGHRVKAWKLHLAAFAAETGLDVTVVHYPPGTSKWNKIEHRMFSFITMNWRGRPLDSYRTIIELINATTTSKGLRIRAARDAEFYETGTKVTSEQFATIPLRPHDWHGDWNYTIASTLN